MILDEATVAAAKGIEIPTHFVKGVVWEAGGICLAGLGIMIVER
jgi:hypothetical protein